LSGVFNRSSSSYNDFRSTQCAPPSDIVQAGSNLCAPRLIIALRPNKGDGIGFSVSQKKQEPAQPIIAHAASILPPRRMGIIEEGKGAPRLTQMHLEVRVRRGESIKTRRGRFFASLVGEPDSAFPFNFCSDNQQHIGGKDGKSFRERAAGESTDKILDRIGFGRSWLFQRFAVGSDGDCWARFHAANYCCDDRDVASLAVISSGSAPIMADAQTTLRTILAKPSRPRHANLAPLRCDSFGKIGHCEVRNFFAFLT